MRKLFLILLLTGCGFTPLYMSGEVVKETSKVEVSAIAGVLGQDLRNQLEHAFNPSGIYQEKEYRLVARLTEREVAREGIREDDTATRITISLQADYKLYQGDKVILTDKSLFLSSYNILQDPYSSYVSHQDALRQLTDLIANDMTLRISLFLKDK